MYRRVAFFKMHYPLSVEAIAKKFKPINETPRLVPDKNNKIKNIKLGCSFEHKKQSGYTYILGMHMEYQLRARKGVKFQRSWDLFAFLFFTKEKMLVVLGRDEVITDAIKIVSNILYGDTQKIKPFGSVIFVKDSLVSIINKLKLDDPDSWCDEHNAYHDGIKYQGRKTKTNFSLGSGMCVLDDNEAKEEIDNATSINPKYCFTKCLKLNNRTYDKPKTLRFNGRNGVISLSIFQDYENWYRFISEFLLKYLEFED